MVIVCKNTYFCLTFRQIRENFQNLLYLYAQQKVAPGTNIGHNIIKKANTLVFIMTFALLVLSGCNEKKNEPSSDPTGDVPVMSITVSPKSCEFTEAGKTVQLVATVLPADATNPKVTWKSSDPEVAAVNSDGLVTSGGGSTGSYLKTTTGWYNNGDGEDRFGFAALPVDVADGSTVSNVGRYASFWTATPFTVDGTRVFYRRIDYNWGSLALSNDPKDVARPVRCLKNPEEDPEE